VECGFPLALTPAEKDDFARKPRSTHLRGLKRESQSQARVALANFDSRVEQRSYKDDEGRSTSLPPVAEGTLQVTLPLFLSAKSGGRIRLYS